MSMRVAALAGGWVIALGVATAVSWAGVRMVGDEVAPTGSGALSQAEVEQRIHAAASTGAATTGAATTGAATTGTATVSRPPAASSGPPAQTSVVARGGTVVVRCVDSVITARYSPATGYAGRQERSDGGRVEVEFRSGAARSKIEAVCRAGIPVTEVKESGGGEDD